MSDLESLREQITSLGEQIKSIKAATPVDKDALTALLPKLLQAKQDFANANNGLDVDGNPYQPPMTKAEKKKKAKEEKAKAAAAAAATTGEKQKPDPNSAGAAKKAAKKAEKAAKKAALKAAAKEQKNTDKPSTAPTTAPPKAAPSANKRPTRSSLSLAVHALAYNPNVPLPDRPLLALSVACLTNTQKDYSIVSDHMRSTPTLGLEHGVVMGDSAIAKYMARRSNLLPEEDVPLLDTWMDYALTLQKLPFETKVKAIAATLNHTLQYKTYIIKNTLSLADVALFCALGYPTQAADQAAIEAILGPSPSPVKRWMSMLASHPAFAEATQLALGISNTEATFSPSTTLDPLVPGMSPLEGATAGNVVTRFPPEPSGYLHVGHAKAVLMNEYYARRYKGRLIVRFDDTNPSKEKSEYQEAIVQDLKQLGVEPDVITFTSDYFGTIHQHALTLIEKGLAFMDDTPQEVMQKERMDRQESKHRNQTPEECKRLFDLLCSGKEEGANYCLRAKIDMTSDNGTLRDPVLFRQNLLPHHRSGTTYKAYPTYDLACPIVDSIEGVTHALRTTEYNDRDEQYAWIQQALGLRRVRIHAFSRMNFQYTVLSKRKLAWFVDQGKVTGWDDARFPTVRGVLRRGVDINALKAFILSQGASRRVVNMEWNKFWAENKKEIDLRAKRFMAIDKENHVEFTVTNGPGDEENVFASADYHPKDASFGKRLIRLCKTVLLEKMDTEGMEVGEEIVLMRWGVVKITKTEGGLEGEIVPDGDFKKAKRKITWLAKPSKPLIVTLYEFDNLVSKEKLEEDDEFEKFVNQNTLATSEVIGDAGLKALKHGDIIQLERRGYFRVDKPYFNDSNSLNLFMVPDGKSKSMSGLSGKLAHR